MNILLGITGSVAAKLVLKTADALEPYGKVNIVTTKWGEYFFDVKNVESLGYRVWRDESEWYTYNKGSLKEEKIWTKKGDPVRHIDIRKWAGVLIIAPLSANTMAKMANGICDNLLTSIYRAWDRTRPVIAAPAMNTMMWEHPITSRHLSTLQMMGVKFVGPVSKELACNDEGMGAMAQIDDIVDQVKRETKWRWPLEFSFSSVPVDDHPGSFGYRRRKSHHSGVDLYCKEGSFVYAMESGRVIGWEHFTGQQDGSPWWNDTDALLVEGPSGIVCYGEININEALKNKNAVVSRGELIGTVVPVVKKGRERPDIPGHSRSMLHVELYERDKYECSAAGSWPLDSKKPSYLCDPTARLAESHHNCIFLKMKP